MTVCGSRVMRILSNNHDHLRCIAYNLLGNMVVAVKVEKVVVVVVVEMETKQHQYQME